MIVITVGKCLILGSVISAPKTVPNVIIMRKSNIGHSPIARSPINRVTNSNKGKMVIILTSTSDISFKKSIIITPL